MPSLLDLPTELLTLILEEVGGCELRRSRRAGDVVIWRGPDRLSICREWYAIARPIYFSGLGTSNVRLYASNLKELDSKLGYAGHRRLMHKNTRNLSIRLLGHFWDDNYALDCEDVAKAGATEDIDEGWEARRNEMPPGFSLSDFECQGSLKRWRHDDLRPRLRELFNDLGNFTALEEVTFMASSDPHGQGQDWDYITLPTVALLVTNLPLLHNLRSLTLDTCGSRLTDDLCSFHLCERLAGIIPMIQDVRLRMINICPTIFAIPTMDSTKLRLKTLVIKLHLPTDFEHTLDRTSEPCFQMRGFSNQLRLHKHLIEAVPAFLAKLRSMRGNTECNNMYSPKIIAGHGLERVFISYPSQNSFSWGVCAFNCLKMIPVHLSGPHYPNHDDGRQSWIQFAESGPRFDRQEQMSQIQKSMSRKRNLGGRNVQRMGAFA